VGVGVEEMTRLLFMCWPFTLPVTLLSRRPGESNLNYVRSIINFTRLTSFSLQAEFITHAHPTN
jgi:hypothetical protein